MRTKSGCTSLNGKGSKITLGTEEFAGKGGTAGLGDTAIGDEVNDLTAAGIREYQNNQKMLDSLRSRFNVWSLVFAGVMGGFCWGSILGAMQIQKCFGAKVLTTKPRRTQ